MSISGLVSLRPAKRSDSRAISRLLYEWLKFGKLGRKREIERAIRNEEIIVATDGRGEVIGFIHGIVHNDPISCGPLLFITCI